MINWIDKLLALVVGICIPVFTACILLATPGCVPLVTGLKEIESGKETTTYRFITGLDIGASANGVDTVDNNRGIKPNGQN